MKERTLLHIEEFVRRYPAAAPLRGALTEAIAALAALAEREGTVLLAGNGGSASDCEHIAGELLKAFVLRRPCAPALRSALCERYGEEGGAIADTLQAGIRAIPLPSLTGVGSAFLNDCDPALVYAQLVSVFGKRGDILIALSTSGNSKNVVAAARVAKAAGMTVIALTGKSGGKLAALADILLAAPECETFKVQEYHLPFYHLLCLGAESEVFEE